MINRVLMKLREILYMLQTGHGRSFYRFLWTWIVGPVVFYHFVSTWMWLLWSVHLAGGKLGDALLRLPPSLVFVFVLLWIVVFLRLRPSDEHPATLIALVRFWRDYDRFQETTRDIPHESFEWTISVPTDPDLASQGQERRQGTRLRSEAALRPTSPGQEERRSRGELAHPAGGTVPVMSPADGVMPPYDKESFPGLQVNPIPRCPKCNLDISETGFDRGFYRVCKTCSFRRISRNSLERSAGEIQSIAEEAWQLLRGDRTKR
jgi:hypothetical protein